MTLREMAGVAAKGQWTEVDAGLPPARPERARDRCTRTLPLWFAGEPLMSRSNKRPQGSLACVPR
jgi:hypothetical protein